MRPDDSEGIFEDAVVLTAFDPRPTAATRAAWAAEIESIQRRVRTQLRTRSGPEERLPPPADQDGGGQAGSRSEEETPDVE